MNGAVISESADPPMVVRAAKAGGLVRTNPAFRAQVGFNDAELAEEPFEHWIASGDLATLHGAFASGQDGAVKIGQA